ncbi:hypothetical protein CRENBAI_008493 [Crenichthys baileyi]|uniref:Fibronectin type-III domain-containing protein n=1 Tax=Crenichthys baileyi TaxID=28760 RepID=A0AAV9RG30_9TELE
MAYKAAVACTTKSSIWSDWSSDATIQTLDRVPSQPPEMCYRVEKTGTDGSLLLHLIWMTPDPGGAKDRVLGYRVSINPHEPVQNVTETTSLLVVKEGNYNITVQAFNTAGFGPAARLQIDTQTQIPLPSVRNLWISSDFPEDEELLVQWTLPGAPSSVLPGSHAVVRWHSERNLFTSRWRRVDGFTSSAVITDVDPDESYLVSVFPVYNQQCGPPQSLAASLQHGALMEVVSLKVVGFTKTTVTVMWAWQKKSAPIRVDRYRLMLRRDTDTRILSLWPDQQHQHTFSNLTPSTEYSLLLLADNVSRTIVLVATHFDEVPVVATATPLLLLVVSVMIISILSRTLYKSYFFPPVSSPRRSTAGQWLLNPNLRRCAQRNLLDITDFQVTDVLGQNHRILVGPNDHLSSEGLHKDKSLQSISNLFVQMSTVKLDKANVSGTKPIRGQEFDIRLITEQQLFSLPSVFTSDMTLLHRHEECSWSPQREEDIYLTSHHQDQSDVQFPELLTDLLRRPETESGSLECSNMIHEVKYLTNGCFRAEPTAGDEISPVLT